MPFRKWWQIVPRHTRADSQQQSSVAATFFARETTRIMDKKPVQLTQSGRDIISSLIKWRQCGGGSGVLTDCIFWISNLQFYRIRVGLQVHRQRSTSDWWNRRDCITLQISRLAFIFYFSTLQSPYSLQPVPLPVEWSQTASIRLMDGSTAW